MWTETHAFVRTQLQFSGGAGSSCPSDGEKYISSVNKTASGNGDYTTPVDADQFDEYLTGGSRATTNTGSPDSGSNNGSPRSGSTDDSFKCANGRLDH